MNKATFSRYERIGGIFAQLAIQKKISPLERLLIDDLQADKGFRTALNLLRILRISEDALSVSEISKSLQAHEETATAMLRALKRGGFELIESQQNIDTGGRILLFAWEPKDNALTYLLESLK